MIETVLSLLRWQDAVDILLNSYILFRLFVLLRGTRLFRVLAIVLLFFFLQRISVSIGLIITSWVMQGITALAAIIVIIVFRNEIRSAFQARNMADILWRLPQKTLETPMDALVEGVFDLSRARIGAIIVLPGTQDLGGIAYGGIDWEGRLSREMVKSIFWPGNPVHDGAAVIGGDRVERVATILPLSIRADLPSHYGTRHRAALGLAEQTDAAVIVVSEERGGVTVAKRDVLKPIATPEQLRAVLDRHTGVARRKASGRREERIQVAATALACLLLVSTIWFSFSTGDAEALATVRVPVEYVNRSQAMEILHTSDSTVEVQMSGPKTLVQAVNPEQVKVRFDLSDATIGTNILSLGQNNVEMPPGIVLKQIVPETIRLDLDMIATKNLPIQVDWVGTLPKGLLISFVDLEPDRVEVKGGKIALDRLDTLYTVKVPVDGLRERGELSVELALKPAGLRVRSLPGNRVRIRYVMARREATQEIP